MSDYDFGTLNSTDLEELVCDLLNADAETNNLTKGYRTFKDGRDKGIDGLLSTNGQDYACVVQVKHYYRSGGKALLRDLKKTEKKKVDLLHPSRYILVTSVDLSVAEVKKIKEIFSPYIRSLDDVWGRKDLNRKLGSYPEILNRHYKIWFSGTEVLKKIIACNFEGRSQKYLEEDIKRMLRLYVKTESYDKARDSLGKVKYVTITGEPGCGKTSLAKVLLYEYIGQGYELNCLISIESFRKMFREDDSLQIFYFDDFLGHNYEEIKKTRASEKHLINCLESIRSNKNKRLILTTRTYILNDAIESSEKLKRTGILSNQFRLNLVEYDFALKVCMLKNHVNESLLDDNLKQVFSRDSIINFIVTHRNFYPRSVEFITNKDYVLVSTPQDFENFVFENFNSPDEIWNHAYWQQITETDRFLLNTMITFGDSVSMGRLRRAFEYRIANEVANNNFFRELRAFDKSIQKLHGSFVLNDNYQDFDRLRFINPSLVDFLLKIIKNDIVEVEKLVVTCVYPLQLTTRLFSLPRKDESLKLNDKLVERIKNNFEGFVLDEDCEIIRMAMLIASYNNQEDLYDYISSCLLKIKDWGALFPEFYSVEALSLMLSDKVLPEETVREIGVDIYSPIVIFDYDFDTILELQKEMKTLYGFLIEDLFELYKNYDWEGYFGEILNSFITESLGNIEPNDDWSVIVDQLWKKALQYKSTIESWGFESKPNYGAIREFLDSRLEDSFG